MFGPVFIEGMWQRAQPIDIWPSGDSVTVRVRWIGVSQDGRIGNGLNEAKPEELRRLPQPGEVRLRRDGLAVREQPSSSSETLNR